jgi:hypothetical protein
MQNDVDAWMPKHFDDSIWHPAISSAANYAVQRDWDPPERLQRRPHPLHPLRQNGDRRPARRLDAPETLEAIEDGAERESQYPALDGEPFNGSILDVVRIHGACASDFAGKGPILAERFDVRDSDAPEFDEWPHGP